jgi:ATP-dependent RNA helicase RhlE
MSGKKYASFRNWRRSSSSSFNRRKKFRRQKAFDPSFLVARSSERDGQAEVYTPKNTFRDFSFSFKLEANIKAKGYEELTPIQDQVIPFVLAGRDVVGLARTGSGKTAAFLLPLIKKVLTKKQARVLIVAPTRELAFQIEAEFKSFSRNLSIFSAVCIGGMSINKQISLLRRRPEFVIGTPGRLKDLEGRRVIYFSDFSLVVLDEVDRMLDMGFIPDVRHIVSRLPQPHQLLFFSATLPDKMRGIANEFLKDPALVSIQSNNASRNVEQSVIKVNGRVKTEILHDLLLKDGFDKVLVFGRIKRGIEKLARILRDKGFWVGSIHGNKTQAQRQRALRQFKKNQVKILVATDVASRGLDIDNVTHVINYDLPESKEDYIHRIGRTGRVDKKGKALTFID